MSTGFRGLGDDSIFVPAATGPSIADNLFVPFTLPTDSQVSSEIASGTISDPLSALYAQLQASGAAGGSSTGSPSMPTAANTGLTNNQLFQLIQQWSAQTGQIIKQVTLPSGQIQITGPNGQSEIIQTNGSTSGFALPNLSNIGGSGGSLIWLLLAGVVVFALAEKN